MATSYFLFTRNDISFYSDVDIPSNSKIRVYISTPDMFDPPTKRFPIAQSYVDVFLGGAIEIEENKQMQDINGINLQ